MNELNREEPMDEKIDCGDDGEHAEVKTEITYFSLLENKDFASKTISRENLFLLGANSKYRQVVRLKSFFS